VIAPESSLSSRVDCSDSTAFKDTNLCCLVKGIEGNVPRGTLLLDAARSSFSSADTGVKTRKLVGRADNAHVVARGVESCQVVLTTRTLQPRLGLSGFGR
jgi:hypothetical protein